MHGFWIYVSRIGGVSVEIPIFLLNIFLISKIYSTTVTARWFVLFVLGAMVTMCSKVLFMGWGIGIKAIDFTGFSGHAFISCAIFTSLIVLILKRGNPSWQRLAWCFLPAILVSISRVHLQAHSISEAIGGLVVGSALPIFIANQPIADKKEGLSFGVLAAAIVMLITVVDYTAIRMQFPLEKAALFLSGHQKLVVRETWLKSAD